MITAFWKYTDHYYSVHITKNGKYDGIGCFCNTWQEVINFCNKHDVSIIRHIELQQEGSIMTVKIVLTDDEQKTINDAINIFYSMDKYTTGEEHIKICSACNKLTEILNDHLS